MVEEKILKNALFQKKMAPLLTKYYWRPWTGKTYYFLHISNSFDANFWQGPQADIFETNFHKCPLEGFDFGAKNKVQPRFFCLISDHLLFRLQQYFAGLSRFL